MPDESDPKPALRLFDPFRLAAGAVVFGALLLPAYFFLLRGDDGDTIQPGVLLDTPPLEGRTAAVGIETGRLAPDFEVSNPEGDRLRLSELRGRPVLINFWATWCASCLAEMPDIQAIQEARGLDAFAVVAVNAGEPLSRAQEFIDFLDAPFLYGLDPGLVISDAYGVYGLPLSVFVDADGVVQAVYRGHAPRDLLEDLVDAAIEARPAGEIPVRLQLITTIPRDRVLRVEARSERLLRFASRSLRCDVSYCAAPAVESLASVPGIVSLELSAAASEPRLEVEYEPGQLREQDVIRAVVTVLESINDPVYDRAIEVIRGRD